jgi:serine/threonine protein phosphatase PrpC
VTASNMIFRLELGKQTAPGFNRSQNEDNIGYFFPQQPEVLLLRGQMFMVADGNGMAGLGEFASKLAVQTVVQEYFEEPWIGTVDEMLTRSFVKANRILIDANVENRSTTPFSTSLTGGVIHQDNLYLAHIGTCRAFLISNQVFEILTQSHSFDVDKRNPEINIPGEENGTVLVRSLGIAEDVKVDLFKRKIQINDLILLCTDGIYNYVNERELQSIIAATPPQQACELMVEQAQVNKAPDDATAMLIKLKSIKRVEADDTIVPSVSDQSEAVERQIVIKGVRYRSAWQEEQLPPEVKETVSEFSQDRDVRRPIMKRKTIGRVKRNYPVRQIFNIITIIAFIAFIAFLVIKYVPGYLQSTKPSSEEGTITKENLRQQDETKLPTNEPKEEAEIAAIHQADLAETEDSTGYLIEQQPTMASTLKLEVVIIDGSFKPNLRWNTFIEGMKLLSTVDQISNVKSSFKLQKSKILWQRSDNSEKENVIKQRVDQYQRLFAQYFGITPEKSPLDLILVIGANFNLPKLQANPLASAAGTDADFYLEILNGFTQSGVARRLSEQLNYRKMDEKRLVVVDYRNADRKNYRVSFMKCYPEQNRFAEKLGSLLGQRLTVNNTQLFDIKLIVGIDIQL